SKFYAKVRMEDGARIPNSLRPALAAGLQLAIEAAVSKMAGDAENLCLAGGLGFNALLIAALERSRNVFVQPSAGNAGSAIGAVLYAWHSVYRESRRVPFETLCLGPVYTAEAIKKALENCKLLFHYLHTADEQITADLRQLSDQKIVAWMQGRMEF